MLIEGQLVKLDNDKEYVVVKKEILHSVNYVYLVSNFKPLEIIIAQEKIEDGKLVIQEVSDEKELDYVLSKLTQEAESDN